MFFMQCGLQDRAGNMWFGSAGDGIYYFNGSVFFNFTKNDGLCQNDILCCFEDNAGNIWFGTRNGLIIYKPTGKQPEKNNFKCILIPQNSATQYHVFAKLESGCTKI
jgi:ligand-binding sensor domain-containing protein